MNELETREGYPIVQRVEVELPRPPQLNKGKSRAVPPPLSFLPSSSTNFASNSNAQNPLSPPPEYATITSPPGMGRRRGSSAVTTTIPMSPLSLRNLNPIGRAGTSIGTIVRAVPTLPPTTPTTARPGNSRNGSATFSAGRVMGARSQRSRDFTGSGGTGGRFGGNNGLTGGRKRSRVDLNDTGIGGSTTGVVGSAGIPPSASSGMEFPPPVPEASSWEERDGSSRLARSNTRSTLDSETAWTSDASPVQGRPSITSSDRPPSPLATRRGDREEAEIGGRLVPDFSPNFSGFSLSGRSRRGRGMEEGEGSISPTLGSSISLDEFIQDEISAPGHARSTLVIPERGNIFPLGAGGPSALPWVSREGATARLRVGERSAAMDMADLLRETGPEDVLRIAGRSIERMEPRPATTGVSDDQEVGEGADRRMAFAEAIQDGPISRSASMNEGMLGSRLGNSSTHSLGEGASSSSMNLSPSLRSSKRWSITGVGSLFKTSPSAADAPSTPPTPTVAGPSHTTTSSPARVSTSVVEPKPTRDYKPAHARADSDFFDVPALPSSAMMHMQQDDHPTNVRPRPRFLIPGSGTRADACWIRSTSSSRGPRVPDCCARTRRRRGRTWLCWSARKENEWSSSRFVLLFLLPLDHTDELVKGSRSISLSLNRTFVLPSTPSTIEFQILGDELASLHLVYADSIFGLEPSTVRVWEVGVGRYRTRRRMRDVEVTPAVVPAPVDELVTASSTLHPADPTVGQSRPASMHQAHPDDQGVGILDRSRTSTPVPPSPNPGAESRPIETSAAAQPSVLPSAAQAPPVPPRSVKPATPYTTFQQLSFVPPIPSSVLSSAWTIPPLYESHNAPHLDEPLLSPISLLAGSSPSLIGPPQLFFVTRGRSVTGIVTGDGRSILRRPVTFGESGETPSSLEDVFTRIEIIIVDGCKTVVVGIGAHGIKAVAIGEEVPFLPAIDVVPSHRSRSTSSPVLREREIQFLGKDSQNQLYYAERQRNSWVVFCLSS